MVENWTVSGSAAAVLSADDGAVEIDVSGVVDTADWRRDMVLDSIILHPHENGRVCARLRLCCGGEVGGFFFLGRRRSTT